jgi:hypothetical protein
MVLIPERYGTGTGGRNGRTEEEKFNNNNSIKY